MRELQAESWRMTSTAATPQTTSSASRAALDAEAELNARRGAALTMA